MWVPGRIDTGYFKKLIFEMAIGTALIDCYILKFPEGAVLPPHTDPLGFWKHYRVNIVLRKAKKGGMFYTTGPGTVFRLPRLCIFRPDIIEHGVTKIEEGTRYVLSFGIGTAT